MIDHLIHSMIFSNNAKFTTEADFEYIKVSNGAVLRTLPWASLDMRL